MRRIVQVYGMGVALDRFGARTNLGRGLPGATVVVDGAAVPASGIVVMVRAAERPADEGPCALRVHVPAEGEAPDPESHLTSGRPIACAAAECLCSEAGLPRDFLGSLLDAVGIKLKACQFGCF
jgi:hypothetical protein